MVEIKKGKFKGIDMDTNEYTEFDVYEIWKDGRIYRSVHTGSVVSIGYIVKKLLDQD